MVRSHVLLHKAGVYFRHTHPKGWVHQESGTYIAADSRSAMEALKSFYEVQSYADGNLWRVDYEVFTRPPMDTFDGFSGQIYRKVGLP